MRTRSAKGSVYSEQQGKPFLPGWLHCVPLASRVHRELPSTAATEGRVFLVCCLLLIRWGETQARDPLPPEIQCE